MNKEEIKVMIKDCVYSEDGITYMSDKQYNNYINIIEQLQQENKKYKEAIEKAINNSQYWIDFYTKLNSDERIALRLQENIDILKKVE